MDLHRWCQSATDLHRWCQSATDLVTGWKSAKSAESKGRLIYPMFYIWVNIDTRGHAKAPESLNIAVGPQDPSPPTPPQTSLILPGTLGG